MFGLLAMVAGGFMAVAILSGIIEQFAFKNREPTKRAELTVGTALIIVAIVAGFGFSNGNGFVWTAGFYYLPGAVIVFLWYRKRYSEAWVDDESVAPSD